MGIEVITLPYQTTKFESPFTYTISMVSNIINGLSYIHGNSNYEIDY